MLVFLALRLCIGHYSPPGGCYKLLEANNSLPMKVQVGHQCQFMPRDGILTKSSQPCEIWLFFWPLRLCLGLYRTSEVTGGLKIGVEVAHKFNFSNGDKITAKLDCWNCLNHLLILQWPRLASEANSIEFPKITKYI